MSSDSVPAVVEVTAFKVPAGQSPAKDQTDPSGATILRAWQRRGFDALRGQRRRILIAPTASGKSTLVKALACDELTSDPSMRAIVAVPQTMIARSFGAIRLRLGQHTFQWAAGHDLADDSPQTIRRLIEFLKAPPACDLAGRILLCTHQTLVRAHQRLIAEGGPAGPWAGVSLYLDETHHSQADAVDVANRLGELVGHWLDAAPGPLTLITATWLRGNLAAIVPSDRMADFARFTLGMDEFLETMEHLREVSFRFLIGNEFEALRHIYGEGDRKTLLWLPHVASRHVRANGGKRATLDAYLSAVGEVVANGAWTTTLRRLSTHEEPIDVRALDLVTEEGREARKAKLYEAIPLGPKHTPDLLVALNLGKEGFDWPECARGVAMGERGSLPEVVQMMGRVLRDHPGKTSAEFDIVLPYHGDERPDPRIVKAYIKTILASMVIEWQLAQTRGRHAKASAATEHGDMADAIMGDPEKASAVIGAVIDAAVYDLMPGQVPDDIIRDALQAAGVNSGCAAEQKETVQRIHALFSARTKAMLDAAGDLPVEIGVHEQVFGCIRILGVKFGFRTLGELREALIGSRGYTDVETLRRRIQGMTTDEYDRAYRKWGPEYVGPSHLRKIYGKTFREIRDGVQGRGNGTACVAADEVRRRIVGVTIARYDAELRFAWGAGWPPAYKFKEIYGETFGEMRGLYKKREYASEEEIRRLASGMTVTEYAERRHDWGPRFPPAGQFRTAYGKTFTEVRGDRCARRPIQKAANAMPVPRDGAPKAGAELGSGAAGASRFS